MGAGEKRAASAKVRTLGSTPNTPWSAALKTQLLQLDTPYVLLMLEDFFLKRPVDSAAILTCLRRLVETDGFVLRLAPLPGPDLRIPGESEFGGISVSAPWRVSTQAGIWNREHLIAILNENESIWEFEVKGTERSRTYTSGYFATYEPLLPYDHHVIERGKWFRWEARRYRKQNIGCDFELRSVMSRAETVIWIARKIWYTLYLLLPGRLQKPITLIARGCKRLARGLRLV